MEGLGRSAVERAYDVLLCLSAMHRGIQTVWTDLQESGDPHPCLVMLCHDLPFPLRYIQRVLVPKTKTKKLNHLASTLMC